MEEDGPFCYLLIGSLLLGSLLSSFKFQRAYEVHLSLRGKDLMLLASPYWLIKQHVCRIRGRCQYAPFHFSVLLWKVSFWFEAESPGHLHGRSNPKILIPSKQPQVSELEVIHWTRIRVGNINHQELDLESSLAYKGGGANHVLLWKKSLNHSNHRMTCHKWFPLLTSPAVYWAHRGILNPLPALMEFPAWVHLAL